MAGIFHVHSLLHCALYMRVSINIMELTPPWITRNGYRV